MRNAIILALFVILSYPVESAGITGVSVGGRIGWSENRGEVLPGVSDLGAGTTYTAILGIGAVPGLDVEFRGSYFEKEFIYSYDVGGVPVEHPFTYRDMGVTALLKRNIVESAGFPFALYAGAGVGVHFLNTEVTAEMASGTVEPPADADDPFAMMENTGKLGGEGVVGLTLAPPAFPLAAFGEYRYGIIFASERLTQSEFAAGLMIRF